MLEKIIIISLIVFAIWYTMQEGEIFGKLGNLFNRILPAWMHNPIYDCPVCMNFWYGVPLYWLIYGSNWRECFIVAIAGIGFNCIITRLWPEK